MKKASNDLISVIIPVYNVEKYLKRCVDSIVAQTYKNLEIILVDDGSLDACPKICDNYAEKDKRITVIHKQNGGLSDARNFGIKAAKGQFIAFVDSDDSVKPTYIEVLYDAIINDHSDISICGNIDIYRDTTIERHPKNRKVYTNIDSIKEVFYDRDIDTCAVSKLFKIELFRNRLFPTGKVFEDTWLIPRLLSDCKKVSVIPKSLYYHYINPNSIVTKEFSPDRMDLYSNTLDVVNYIINLFPSLKKASICKMTHSCISTAMSLVKSETIYREYETLVFSYVRKNILRLFLDTNAPIKYKVGALSMLFGRYPFKLFLNIYNKRRACSDD